MSYFIYGKRQQRLSFLAAGVCLCIFPYLVDELALQILVGVALLAAPFFVNV